MVDYLLIVICFLVCSNLYVLFFVSSILKQSSLNYTKYSILNPKCFNDQYTFNFQSNHLVNIIDYPSMDPDYIDYIFNNLNSIIVQDEDLDTSRYQITKVSWLFDNADTMLLYTAFGKIFTLATNGTISVYRNTNDKENILQYQTGWLVHYGAKRKKLKNQEINYKQIRESKKIEYELLRKMSEENNRLLEAEQNGHNITNNRKVIEDLQDELEIILDKRKIMNHNI